MDTIFRQLLRQASSTGSPLDYEAVITAGKRAGMTVGDLVMHGIPIQYMAEELAVLRVPVGEWSVTGAELGNLGIDATTIKGATMEMTGIYVPVKTVKLPLYEDLKSSLGEDRAYDEYHKTSKDYSLLPTGVVLVRASFSDPQLVTDPAIIDQVHRVVGLAATVGQARDILAERHSGNDPIFRRLLRWHIWYNDGYIGEPQVIEGVPFWPVGRNASCSFFAGYLNGQRYRYSWCEGDEGEPHATPVDEWAGYYGHA
jgi:hypothetical protein